MATHMDVQVEGVTDPIDGFNNTKAAPSAPEYGPDSDDETLRFEEDDDLYASDADEADAKWVRKQHRPATQCEEQGDGREGIADCWRSQGDVESSWGDSEESDSDPVLENGEEEDGIGGVHGEGRAPVKENTQNKMKNKKKATAGIAAGMGIVSDAQLSCPLCFTTVCLECQRHARYHTQFRAVSAMNVVVRDDVSLCLDDISGQRKKKKNRKNGGCCNRNGASGAKRNQQSPRPAAATGVAAGAAGDGGGKDGQDKEEEEELFHPVCCRECDHRVGVMDRDEVFHFFGVMASG